jgi:hypothetical protein
LTRASSTARAASLATRRRRVITRSGIATLTRLRTGRPATKSSTIQAASTPNWSAVGASCGGEPASPRIIASV